jgi:nucleoside-diphosphate-sugar epimerase
LNVLVTGGAGFIGRWVVKQLLDDRVGGITVLDNFSNARPENLAEYAGRPELKVLRGDVADGPTLDRVWSEHGPFDVVWHLAAQIRVQESIDRPWPTFHSDVAGTVQLLERCRRQYFRANGVDQYKPFHLPVHEGNLRDGRPRLVFMSTCMVYSRANGKGIDENHPTHPGSPYAASKIAGENLVLSYHHAYRMATKVIRPFNTYGPFQKRNSEGGVVAIFIARDLAGQPLLVKGDGHQTRDLLYVEDCARFVIAAGLTEIGDGKIINAGLGEDIAVRDLAALVADPRRGGNGVPVQFIEHDHPQAEIPKLLCDNRMAQDLFRWRPEVNLEEGIRRTRNWIANNAEAL